MTDLGLFISGVSIGISVAVITLIPRPHRDPKFPRGCSLTRKHYDEILRRKFGAPES